MNGSRKAAFVAAAFAGVLAAAIAFVSRAEAKPPVHAAEVSYLEGKAKRTASGVAVQSALAQGDQLMQGDLVSTEPKSRLELRLDDKSILRIGANAQLALTEAQFSSGQEKRKLSVKLFFGNLWAKVTSVVNSDQRFAVETENAVAGVRGTTFRVDARPDKSVVVRVYDGSVAVAKPGAAGTPPNPQGTLRREVSGPEEVTRAQWEKLVGAQMQIVISATGVPGEPTHFTDSDESNDAFAKWNQERDTK